MKCICQGTREKKDLGEGWYSMLVVHQHALHLIQASMTLLTHLHVHRHAENLYQQVSKTYKKKMATYKKMSKLETQIARRPGPTG